METCTVMEHDFTLGAVNVSLDGDAPDYASRPKTEAAVRELGAKLGEGTGHLYLVTQLARNLRDWHIYDRDVTSPAQHRRTAQIISEIEQLRSVVEVMAEKGAEKSHVDRVEGMISNLIDGMLTPIFTELKDKFDEHEVKINAGLAGLDEAKMAGIAAQLEAKMNTKMDEFKAKAIEAHQALRKEAIDAHQALRNEVAAAAHKQGADVEALKASYYSGSKVGVGVGVGVDGKTPITIMKHEGYRRLTKFSNGSRESFLNFRKDLEGLVGAVHGRDAEAFVAAARAGAWDYHA